MVETTYNGLDDKSYYLFEYCSEKTNCSIKKKSWVNSKGFCIAPENKPSALEGFKLNLTIEAPSKAHLMFFEQFYNKMAKDINYLEFCLCDNKNKDGQENKTIRKSKPEDKDN